jgi:hypothetical protein
VVHLCWQGGGLCRGLIARLELRRQENAEQSEGRDQKQGAQWMS